MGKDTEFLEAARSGNITLVEKILNQRAKWTGPLASLRRGPGANVQDNSGYSALHHATLNGHVDVVKLLLAHDASPNLPDIRGSSPLHLAAWAGHQDIVKLFLTHPNRQANPNLQTVDNETPLHFAAQHGHTGALTTLLAHGADPNVTNNRNETPLDLAAQYGRLQVVQMLIRAHPELLDAFKADTTTTGSSLDGGGYSGGDSSTGSNTSISRANRQCPHRNMILSHSPLHLASRNGHKNVVEVLLAAGVNVNLLTTAGTALHEAALCGKDSVVRTLLDFGADLDATDCENRTALNILEEFPPHVTKGIVSVINNHRNSILYDSESDDLRDYNSHSSSVQYHHRQRFQDYQQKQYRNNHNCFGNSLHHDIAISPSSSMGSLGPPSPHQRASNGDLSSDFYVPMEPSKKFKTSAPKKPPRRNLSISPTHVYGSGQAGGGGGRDAFMSVSVDGGYPAINNRSGGSGSDTSSKHYPQSVFNKYEYIYLAHSGIRQNGERNAGGRIHQRQQPQNDTDYIQMMPKPEPRNSLTHSYENTTFKSYNPNRKLRRNRDNCYEQFSVDLIRDKNKDYSVSAESVGVPPSPTHYQQPPTPEHPPPSAVQAETFIHESIRPLSQEYKRRSVGIFPQQKQHRKNPSSNLTIESGTSPSEPLYQSLCASSGSLSSSISISDRSVSTDCVEEFIGDVPFAGLFKGSTMTLNNFSSNYPLQSYHRYQQQGNNYLNSNATNGKGYNTSSTAFQKQLHERPRTLCTQEQLQPYFNDPRFEYQQSRSLSFGGIVTNNLNSTDDDDTLRERQHSFSADDRDDNGQSDDHQQYHHDQNSDGQKMIAIDRKIASISSDLKPTANVISPFDEDEAWAKISEIMQSFGSGILSTSKTTERKMGGCDDDDDDDDDDTAISEKDHLDNNAKTAVDSDCIIRNEDGAGENSNNGKYLSLRQFLMVYKLQHLENILMENGFDRVEHLNGILDETDLDSMNISLQPDGSSLLDAIQKLPTTSSLLLSEKQQRQHKQNNNNNNSISILNVDQWLQAIHLSEYGHIFKRHLCTNLDGGVCRVWEAELQTVLEIQKIGHRKRILHSISSNRTLPTATTAIMSELSTELTTPEVNIMNIGENLDQKSQNQRNEQQQQQQQGREGKPLSNVKHNKKNRPAPKPPIRAALLEIRAPSELLLGLPSNLRTQWRHPANVLITSAVTYDVFYLGSTVVKELRGTESTRKSIQKLKRDNHSSCHSNIQFTSDGRGLLTEPSKKQLVRLSISHRGVEFINTELKSTICEHEIRNIHCACQDADDLSHFAYITKDADINIHYCHVFNADSMDLATEIILTLGQAFEVAYQLALRDSTQNVQFNRKAVVDVIK